MTVRRTNFSLVAEPRGRLYRELIDYAVDECTDVLLVVRHAPVLTTKARRVLDQLQPFLREKREASEWPGTRLLDETATVLRYRAARELGEVVKQVSEGLYDWVQPDLPEDLCFLRGGTPWLVIIAHERDGYFSLTPGEWERLVSALPEMESYLEA